MRGFLEDFGFLAICFAVAYGYKKILEYCDLKRMALHEDEKVYRAAEEFARGVPSDEIGAVLSGCLGLEGADVGKILSRAIPHRTDRDGGYRALLRSVDRALGDDVYSGRRRTHLHK